MQPREFTTTIALALLGAASANAGAQPSAGPADASEQPPAQSSQSGGQTDPQGEAAPGWHAALDSTPRPRPEVSSTSAWFNTRRVAPSDPTRPANEDIYRATSLFYAPPPEPRRFSKHDLITIIVDETTANEARRSLETDKSGSMSGNLANILDPMQLLQLRLQSGDISNLDLVGLDHNRDYAAEGETESESRFRTRITAEVLEVKPNGTIVLQAKRTIRTDDHTETITLTGTARQEDITDANTVLSTLLSGFELTQESAGELQQNTKKGIFTRALETLFAF